MYALCCAVHNGRKIMRIEIRKNIAEFCLKQKRQNMNDQYTFKSGKPLHSPKKQKQYGKVIRMKGR